MRIILFCAIVMTMIAAAFLFRVKHEVLAIERRFSNLSNNIAHVQQEMNTLRNELAYLTQPTRMAALGGKYLKKLGTLRPNQLIPSTTARKVKK